MVLRAFVFGLCIAVFSASMLLFVRDYRAAFFLRGTTNDQIAWLTSANYTGAQATSARRLHDLLSNCARLWLSAPALKANPDLAETVRQRCADFAGQVIHAAPANGRARALAMLMAPQLSAQDFGIAQQVAPLEPWPLSTRLSAIAAAKKLTPELQTLATADFANALLSFWGRNEVVKLYTRHSKLRPMIQAALTSLPPTEQANFIHLLRQSLARGVL